MANLTVFGRYEIQVSGEEYESADPSVGLQGGYMSFDLEAAFDQQEREDLTPEQLGALWNRIADDNDTLLLVLEACGDDEWQDEIDD
jgi:hypothetical protein